MLTTPCIIGTSSFDICFEQGYPSPDCNLCQEAAMRECFHFAFSCPGWSSDDYWACVECVDEARDAHAWDCGDYTLPITDTKGVFEANNTLDIVLSASYAPTRGETLEILSFAVDRSIVYKMDPTMLGGACELEADDAAFQLFWLCHAQAAGSDCQRCESCRYTCSRACHRLFITCPWSYDKYIACYNGCGAERIWCEDIYNCNQPG